KLLDQRRDRDLVFPCSSGLNLSNARGHVSIFQQSRRVDFGGMAFDAIASARIGGSVTPPERDAAHHSLAEGFVASILQDWHNVQPSPQPCCAPGSPDTFPF